MLRASRSVSKIGLRGVNLGAKSPLRATDLRLSEAHLQLQVNVAQPVLEQYLVVHVPLAAGLCKERPI